MEVENRESEEKDTIDNARGGVTGKDMTVAREKRNRKKED